MATTTTSTTTTTKSEEDGPKYRIEHSISDAAGCQQAACKRAKIKIQKGELRLGILSWYEPEEKYIRLWRHWGCVTKKQIQAIKELAEEDPTKVDGYDFVSAESQEQVRLAFQEGIVVDKTFKDIRIDLANRHRNREIRNAVGYKVEVTTRRSAGCRNPACNYGDTKIAKGELRLGIATIFLEEHLTWGYKHWRCISKFDLERVQEYYEQDELEGIDSLPDEYRTTVLESLEKNEVVDPPMLELEPAKKARRSRKKRVDSDDDDSDPPTKTKKSRKITIDTEDDEPELPRKAQKSCKKNSGNSDDEKIVPKKGEPQKRVADEAEGGEEAEEEVDVVPRPKRKKRSRR